MRIDELTSAGDLHSIEPEWWSLYERCPGATPFHSPDWLITWWKHFGFGDLWTLAVWEENHLVALAPLFIHTYQDGSSGAIRQVSPVGIGITDYTDFLFEPQYAAAASGLILRRLSERCDRWDAADLSGLREGCALPQAAVPDGLAGQIIADQPCPFINLPESPEDCLSGLNANRRHNYRNARKKLSQAGALMFEEADPDSWREQLEALFVLHQACRRDRDLEAGLGDPRVQDFHRQVAPAFLRRGWLKLSAMRIDGSIAAVLYAFADGRRLFCYQSGFDTCFGEMSPGTQMVGYTIERAIREGLTELDFLRGNEPYKYWWGAHDRQTYRLMLWH